MQIEQRSWTRTRGWDPAVPIGPGDGAQVVFVFGATQVLSSGDIFADIRSFYPHAQLFGCTTSGEIRGTAISDDGVVVTAVRFAHSTARSAAIRLDDVADSLQAGARLAAALDKEGLRHVLALSDGLKVNGSDLVRGLTGGLPEGVTVTGGLAGDGERFKETLVVHGERAQKEIVAVLGIYGDRIAVGYGSLGGWDPFGPERLITRSSGNVLYELDGKSALELYKRYLGEHASGLPATGLLFPLSLRTADATNGVVRTILSVDEERQSMTFAGDVPEGAWARLMKANFDRLIDGAAGAARTCLRGIGSGGPQLGICISCVGRRLVLKQRTEEEVEGVRDVLGPQAVLTGFYSYGEISPLSSSVGCALHNQTMTITSLEEW
jgi:hypothetical protein